LINSAYNSSVTYVRLGESVQTLYSELLDQLRVADAEAAVHGLNGTFVSKEVRGRTYWYLQKSEGASKRQIYLGVETPQLRARIEAGAERRALTSADEKRRREIVGMLEAGGMYRETASIGVVLRVLSEASVFRAGGVLVGTQAYTVIANMLGVIFEKATLRTADVDVAHDTTIPLGLQEPPLDMLERLKERDPAFFAVPGIDSREPSTSFKVRGRDLRVDFLTPMAGRRGVTKPVYLPHLRVAAQPLVGLDYVLEGSVDAAAIVGSGIHVHVPGPARFALHKLWLASERSAAEAAKARKDLRQAEQLLEILADDRPGDVSEAWAALGERKSLMRGAKAGLQRLAPALRERLRDILNGAR
jgi:hypothetical protein